MTALWWAARRKERSTRWLINVDLATAVLQGFFLAILMVGMLPLIRIRPDIVCVLGLTYVLVARAALLPSSASRTALIGVLTALPTCSAILVAYRFVYANGTAVAQVYPGDTSTPIVFFLWALLYASLSVSLSTFVSGVIYGLQRAVQNARQLGQYTLEDKIGEGGMGVVYRGRHALLRRPTAIKLLPPERAGAAAVARFEREVQITSQLTHPNTVAIYDYGRTPENVFYYAMEYLEGIDLEDLVRQNGPQPAGRVRHFIRQVVGALSIRWVRSATTCSPAFPSFRDRPWSRSARTIFIQPWYRRRNGWGSTSRPRSKPWCSPVSRKLRPIVPRTLPRCSLCSTPARTSHPGRRTTPAAGGPSAGWHYGHRHPPMPIGRPSG